MRLLVSSLLPTLLLLYILTTVAIEGKTQVPVLGPQTFDNTNILSDGWVVQYVRTQNTWEVISPNSYYFSSGYRSPDASGGNHIKIDATASNSNYLFSPIIDCSNVTKGVLKFGVLRSADYNKKLYVEIDANADGSYEFSYLLPYTDIPTEKWKLITIDLGSLIDNKPVVKIRFSQYGSGSLGPLRIDDITLYGYTVTSPTDHFRTRYSGDWNNITIWESSRDSVSWMPSTLSPTDAASSITIQSTHSVTNTTPLTADQLTIKSGGVLLLAHAMELRNSTGDDATVEEGALLDVSTHHLTGEGTIQLNGHLKTANPEGLYGTASASIATGILLNNPGSNSLIEYNATGPQYISSQIGYVNLAISGSGDKTLMGSTQVSNNLQINGGYLALAEYNLTVGNTARGTSSSYVKTNSTGKLTITNISSDPKIFPIGNASFNPVTITNGSGLDWTVGIQDRWVSNDPGLEALSDKAVHRLWSILPSINPPPAAANIQLEYNDTDPLQIGNSFRKDDPVLLWHQAAEGWLIVNDARSSNSPANERKVVTFTSETAFSLFAVSNIDTPLPVRFKDVRALPQSGVVLIFFTNETEGGIEDYSLERSADGQTYTSLQLIRPQKNNGSATSYELQDAAPLQTLNLYRIKAQEKTGRITYSPVLRVNREEERPRITIVPNPVDKAAVSLQLTNVPPHNYRLNLYDAKGQLLLHQQLNHAGGSSSYPLLIDQLQPGTYIVELIGKEKLLQRFVVL